MAGLGQGDGQVHRHRGLADAALARGDPDHARGGVGAEEGRHRRGRGVPVPGVVVTVVVTVAGGGAPEHAGAQAVPQHGPRFVVHHHEVELDLLDARDAHQAPVDPLGQLVGAGPRRHGQGHLDEHPAPARPHRTDQAEIAERQAQLGVLDRAERSLEL